MTMGQDQQKQDEESRMMKSLEVLQRIQFAVRWMPVSSKTPTEDDVRFLAAELGLTTQFNQENR